jgi:hypothetical protein
VTPRRPRHVDDVFENLRNWSRGTDRVRRRARIVSELLPSGAKLDVYCWRGVRGQEMRTFVKELEQARRRIAALLREARRRRHYRDWDWFWWLAEFGVLSSSKVNEDWHEAWGPALQANLKARIHLEASSQKAAETRRQRGEKTREAVLNERPGQRVNVTKDHKRRIRRDDKKAKK